MAKLDIYAELASVKSEALRCAANGSKSIQAGDISLKTRASKLSNIVFFTAVAVLAVITLIQLVAGKTDAIELNFICIIVIPVIYYLLSNGKAFFAVEGIQIHRRNLWWDDIEDLKIDRKNRVIYIESKDGYIRKLLISKKEGDESYDRVSEFARRMLTMAAARSLSKSE